MSSEVNSISSGDGCISSNIIINSSSCYYRVMSDRDYSSYSSMK